jgi:hypothetical protein
VRFDPSDELRKELIGRIACILWCGNRHVNGIELLPNFKRQEGAAVLLPGHHGAHPLDGVRRIPERQYETVTVVAQQCFTSQRLDRVEPVVKVAWRQRAGDRQGVQGEVW